MSVSCRWTRCFRGWAVLTVEPVLFLFMFAGSFMWLTIQAMTYEKVCIIKFNSTVCDNLNQKEFAAEEDVVQTITSHWFLRRIFCDEVPAIACSFYYGSFSDRVNRKLALLMPLIGMAIANGIYLINAIHFDLPVWMILLGSLGSGLFGGMIACSLAVYSYISSITERGSRTVRMALAESLTVLGGSIGHFLSGHILDMTSYTFVLHISLAVFILDILYVWYFVPNISGQTETNAITCESMEKVCVANNCGDFTVVLKPRAGNNRLHIILTLTAMSFTVLGGSASWILGYLYLKRQPLSWSQSTYGYYVGCGHLMKGVVVVLILPVIKNRLQTTDTGVLLVALALHAVSEAFFGFSTQTWMVFAALSVDFLHGAIHTCYRSLLSLLVDAKEYGQVFAILGSLQSLCILIASTVYNNVYPLTLEIWAGLCFFGGSILMLSAMIVMIFVHCDLKGSPIEQKIISQTSVFINAPEMDPLKCDGLATGAIGAAIT